MNILAIDTSTTACTVALKAGDECYERFVIAPREHANLVLPMIESVLAEAGLSRASLDYIAYGCGPGSFTGVRIAAGIVQGIALALDLPVVPVSSLRCVAQVCFDQHQTDTVLAAFDARMKEVYWGLYSANSDGVMLLSDTEHVSPADDVCVVTNNAYGAGDGWGAYAHQLQQKSGISSDRVDATIFPHGKQLAELAVYEYSLGVLLTADQALPTYLRNNVTHRPAAK
ncbi:MAG: tRNA (adenosine(37)-N6)-threonylcarbamoyltransferase complex dimerization subunit type 1 TsaB [Gammaproteobacteria bacterium]|nr:tRNA (adenosine(37)-N6)-threonylcarbamoyltransferase complex dimerization subunit type 1 TsaB [Gammaproteobacteria bacterium]